MSSSAHMERAWYLRRLLLWNHRSRIEVWVGSVAKTANGHRCRTIPRPHSRCPQTATPSPPESLAAPCPTGPASGQTFPLFYEFSAAPGVADHFPPRGRREDLAEDNHWPCGRRPGGQMVPARHSGGEGVAVSRAPRMRSGYRSTTVTIGSLCN